MPFEENDIKLWQSTVQYNGKPQKHTNVIFDDPVKLAVFVLFFKSRTDFNVTLMNKNSEIYRHKTNFRQFCLITDDPIIVCKACNVQQI